MNIKVLRVTIEMDLETGNVKVIGPLDQKPLVCNALARAITAVIEHVEPVIRPVGNGNGILKTN